jgi:hypothetical protein
MILTKSLKLLFLGFVIGCYLFVSLGQKPTLAANLSNKLISQETIAFKRIRNDGETSFFLRLVGFPTVAEITVRESFYLI